MARHYTSAHSRQRGSGLISTLANAAGAVINKTIDLLPIELHVPKGINSFYQFCGPGTDLKKRLARGDKGVNKLDSYCKEHDIAYANNSDSRSRAVADRILADKAWERVKASDSSIGEKATAWTITNIMKAKSKLGGGRRDSKKVKPVIKKKVCTKKKQRSRCSKKQKSQNKKGKGLYLRPYKQGSGYKKKLATHRK